MLDFHLDQFQIAGFEGEFLLYIFRSYIKQKLLFRILLASNITKNSLF